jgi:hypothetical protein
VPILTFEVMADEDQPGILRNRFDRLA